MKLFSLMAIEEIGEGTRVCLDFVDVLEADEGVLVGNTGHGYLLLLSEHMQTATYPPRPFRVNAGAIHQYLLLDGDNVCYLSDVKAGMLVPVWRKNGESRLVAIGRIKVEKRPLVRLCLHQDGVDISATLQLSDSIRLAGCDGSIAMLDTVVQDTLLCRSDQPGRHIGARIEEYIREY